MPVKPIALAGPGIYLAMMLTRSFQLLALVALVLMSFTMTAAPAQAHGMPGMTADQHCGEHPQPQAPPSTDMAKCMLMCVALPAAEPVAIAEPEMPKGPRRLVLAETIRGIILEIATPPPRSA